VVPLLRAEEDQNHIQWYSHEEGLVLAKKMEKPILVNFTAAWCRYCHMMKKETYSDHAVISYVNEHYVPVRVDTQRDQATAASYYVRSIPIIWFLSSDGQKITSLPGYVDAPTFLKVLSYIATEAYQAMDFESYLKSQSEES
jgi:thioredoxin-related protein